ncbi:uncharacterized protein LOC134670874 [Cydia fagiglandana]|uniref:uncharacterized protein LOC134670874 n=1 Tax=Cydia fagiglandana TaxID=1458189 RepID=UPI002FEE29A9
MYRKLMWCYVFVLTLLDLSLNSKLTAQGKSHGVTVHDSLVEGITFQEWGSEAGAGAAAGSGRALPPAALRASPPALSLGRAALGAAHAATVTLTNTANTTMHLASIAGTTPDFHASFFDAKTLACGANTSFSVVFLGRREGPVSQHLYIHTSLGVLKYPVSAIGVASEWALWPLVGVRVPHNATLRPLLHMHNPTDHPVQVMEMYSSASWLGLQLPEGGASAPREHWTLPPHSTRALVRLRLRLPGKDTTAYIRIKANVTGAPLVVVVEAAAAAGGVYAEPLQLRAGTRGAQDNPYTFSISLGNSEGSSPAVAGGAAGSCSRAPHAPPAPGDAPLLANGHHNGGAAEGVHLSVLRAHLEPHQEPERAAHLTLDFAALWAGAGGEAGEEAWCAGWAALAGAALPYSVRLLPGTLRLPTDLHFVTADEGSMRAQEVRARNEFRQPVHIVAVEFPPDLLQHFETESWAGVPLAAGAEALVARLRLRRRDPDAVLDSRLHVRTNLTHTTYSVGVLLYGGHLHIEWQWPGADARTLPLGALGTSSTRRVVARVRNPAPAPLCATAHAALPGATLALSAEGTTPDLTVVARVRNPAPAPLCATAHAALPGATLALSAEGTTPDLTVVARVRNPAPAPLCATAHAALPGATLALSAEGTTPDLTVVARVRNPAPAPLCATAHAALPGATLALSAEGTTPDLTVVARVRNPAPAPLCATAHAALPGATLALSAEGTTPDLTVVARVRNPAPAPLCATAHAALPGATLALSAEGTTPDLTVVARVRNPAPAPLCATAHAALPGATLALSAEGGCVPAGGWATAVLTVVAPARAGPVLGSVWLQAPAARAETAVSLAALPGAVRARLLHHRGGDDCQAAPWASGWAPALVVESTMALKMKLTRVEPQPPDPALVFIPPEDPEAWWIGPGTNTIGHVQYLPELACGSACYTGLTIDTEEWLQTSLEADLELLLKRRALYEAERLRAVRNVSLAIDTTEVSTHRGVANKARSRFDIDTTEMVRIPVSGWVRWGWPRLAGAGAGMFRSRSGPMYGSASNVKTALRAGCDLARRLEIEECAHRQCVYVPGVFTASEWRAVRGAAAPLRAGDDAAAPLRAGHPAQLPALLLGPGAEIELKIDFLPPDAEMYSAHDNAPIHTSAIVTKSFEENQIEVLDWPSLSPDLNIMENAWGWLSRNNLTIVEAVQLGGRGAVPRFELGGRRAHHHHHQPILLQIPDCEEGQDCEAAVASPEESRWEVRRALLARNTGAVPLRLRAWRLAGEPCAARGFRLDPCAPLTLQPNETRALTLSFRTDCSLARVPCPLTLRSDSGPAAFRLLGAVPARLLPICARQQPRPAWEPALRASGALLAVVALALVLAAAALDAERLLRRARDARQTPAPRAPLDLRALAREQPTTVPPPPAAPRRRKPRRTQPPLDPAAERRAFEHWRAEMLRRDAPRAEDESSRSSEDADTQPQPDVEPAQPQPPSEPPPDASDTEPDTEEQPRTPTDSDAASGTDSSSPPDDPDEPPAVLAPTPTSAPPPPPPPEPRGAAAARAARRDATGGGGGGGGGSPTRRSEPPARPRAPPGKHHTRKDKVSKRRSERPAAAARVSPPQCEARPAGAAGPGVGGGGAAGAAGGALRWGASWSSVVAAGALPPIGDPVRRSPPSLAAAAAPAPAGDQSLFYYNDAHVLRAQQPPAPAPPRDDYAPAWRPHERSPFDAPAPRDYRGECSVGAATGNHLFHYNDAHVLRAQQPPAPAPPRDDYAPAWRPHERSPFDAPAPRDYRGECSVGAATGNHLFHYNDAHVLRAQQPPAPAPPRDDYAPAWRPHERSPFDAPAPRDYRGECSVGAATGNHLFHYNDAHVLRAQQPPAPAPPRDDYAPAWRPHERSPFDAPAPRDYRGECSVGAATGNHLFHYNDAHVLRAQQPPAPAPPRDDYAPAWRPHERSPFDAPAPRDYRGECSVGAATGNHLFHYNDAHVLRAQQPPAPAPPRDDYAPAWRPHERSPFDAPAPRDYRGECSVGAATGNHLFHYNDAHVLRAQQPPAPAPPRDDYAPAWRPHERSPFDAPAPRDYRGECSVGAATGNHLFHYNDAHVLRAQQPPAPAPPRDDYAPAWRPHERSPFDAPAPRDYRGECSVGAATGNHLFHYNDAHVLRAQQPPAPAPPRDDYAPAWRPHERSPFDAPAPRDYRGECSVGAATGNHLFHYNDAHVLRAQQPPAPAPPRDDYAPAWRPHERSPFDAPAPRDYRVPDEGHTVNGSHAYGTIGSPWSSSLWTAGALRPPPGFGPRAPPGPPPAAPPSPAPPPVRAFDPFHSLASIWAPAAFDWRADPVRPPPPRKHN